jgi:dCTP diphosphatase
MQLTDIIREIDEFVRSNDWHRADSDRPQTPRNLATSIAIEAAELLECFQWSDTGGKEELTSELADVLIYALRFAQVTGIDPLDAIRSKLEANRHRVWPKRG